MLDENDEFLDIIEDSPEDDAATGVGAWNILIVDDDEEVHQATRFAIGGIRILGKELRLLHAYSAAQAREVLASESDIAVVFLDVVMESNDAGLELVSTIRDQLDLQEVRIILRTGQPGYAPETEVITHYDINDYRSKNELTQTRLLTSLTTALRSYQQIRTISNSREGLNQIISATSDLLTTDGLHQFAAGVIKQLSGFFALSLDGLIAVRRELTSGDEHINIIAAGDRYKGWLDHDLLELDDTHVKGLITSALKDRSSHISEREAVLYFDSREQPIAAYVTSELPIPEPDQSLLRLFCQNIAMCSDNVSMIGHLNDYAYKDQITGLPNRNLFVEQVQHLLERQTAKIALVVLDIDHFNALVETIGTRGCDQLLYSASRHLLDAFDGKGGFLARIGGDVFGILVDRDRVDPATIPEIFAEPLAVGEMDLPVSATAGIVHLDGIKDHITAISAGYAALKRAKDRHRGGYFLYSEDMSKEMTQRVSILHRLRSALNAREFYLVFQPQIELATGRVVGLETLIRWQNDKGEFIAPSVFIPIAENTGMIIDIGNWVFENSCRHLRLLLDRGYPNISISVNVSAAQLKDPDFLSQVERNLTVFNIPANAVDIEITETLAMEDLDYCVAIVDRLKLSGLHVSLDDFGTGYSSLTYLQRLNIDRLKIDRSFIEEIGVSEASERIIKTIVSLGHQLSLDVLAEGIETDRQARFLLDNRCDTVQGYHYARPLAFDQLLDWLDARD